MRLDAATVLLQWATGGMAGCWVTTRHRVVGLGYGWLLRSVYGVRALGALVVGVRYETIVVREISSALVALSCAIALGVSVRRRGAGVAGQIAEHDRRTAAVAAQTGIERVGRATTVEPAGPEFDPRLDLVPVAVGAVGIIAGALEAGGNDAVAVARILVGAAFLGMVTDAMLLGHWYLVQPGLPRRHLNELVTLLLWLWPAQVVVMLLPTGMASVLTGTVDDGWNGTLGWMWVACSVATVSLVWVTRLALRERSYSAVMAATGLLYLAILTAFGMDLVARAVLS
jgi:hypothetical protein